jgi:ABC-type glycerol-3-phosphate transport system permease component
MRSRPSDLHSRKFVSIRGSKWLLLGIGMVVVFVVNFPVLTVALNSFRTTENILSNEFFISSIFLRDENRMTVPVGIQSFMQQYGTDWGSLMASATLAMVPTLILFLFVQKYLIAGATAGAVKG